jgi:hypothetical protein
MLVERNEDVRRLQAEAAAAAAALPGSYNAAIESRDAQLRALEKSLVDECRDKESLAARVVAMEGERAATQRALRALLMNVALVQVLLACGSCVRRLCKLCPCMASRVRRVHVRVRAAHA